MGRMEGNVYSVRVRGGVCNKRVGVCGHKTWGCGKGKGGTKQSVWGAASKGYKSSNRQYVWGSVRGGECCTVGRMSTRTEWKVPCPINQRDNGTKRGEAWAGCRTEVSHEGKWHRLRVG